MTASLNSTSVIWVIGEAAGVDQSGITTAAIPASNETETDATQTELDALEARILASGILPSVTF